MEQSKGIRCVVVVGAGVREGLGGAIVARFAQAGYRVFAVGRSQEKLNKLCAELTKEKLNVSPLVADCSKPESVLEMFDKVAAKGLVPEVVVFNASEPNMPKSLLEMTPEYIENMWRVCCFGGVLVGQEAIRRMLPQKTGTLLFTGATASLRGGAKFGAFAAAKAALRSHAQSMAREFGPKGLHVAHVVIDGIVNGDRAGSFGFGLGKAYLKTKGDDGTILPEAVAEQYWQLHCQHRSAWTQELDLRPFKESF